MQQNGFGIFKISYLLASVVLIFSSGAAQEKIIVVPDSIGLWGNRFIGSEQPEVRPRIGVVLSGGGARGLAQIGVLRTLERFGIPIDFIVGNSLGSVVGGLYSSGYTTDEIENIALSTDWSELLSFTEETKRTDLYLGQKKANEEGYFSIRFEGLEPIIPSSISGGQRLFNFFSYLTLQALYHPTGNFDDLKIPFRAVATDLISGRRIILDRGSLAEALRASVTVPLLYSPIERDSMYMVDGGLRSNIPADIARSMGSDIVIVVNSTSSMRKPEQMKAPWEIADQIMTIMMQESNREQLKLADVIITPDCGERIVSDFSGIDGLIRAGEKATEELVGEIVRKIRSHTAEPFSPDSLILRNAEIKFAGGAVSQEVQNKLLEYAKTDRFSLLWLRQYLSGILSSGKYSTVYAEVSPGWDRTLITVNTKVGKKIESFKLSGNELLSGQQIDSVLAPCLNKDIADHETQSALEKVVGLYRSRGYSLARIDSVGITGDGQLRIRVSEGRISSIRYEGSEKTRDYILRRELPFTEGDIFNIDKATQGVTNIKSTGLFDYVFLDVKREDQNTVIVLKVKEKSSEIVRIGFHADEEHGMVSLLDLRDANFRGAWEDIGIFSRYGFRDRMVRTTYTINRLFHSYLTLSLSGYYKSRDIITYRSEPSNLAKKWERVEESRYEESKVGGTLTFGSLFRRLGDVSGEFRWERHKIRAISGLSYPEASYKFASIKFQSTIDSEDKYNFPTKGIYLLLTFESASKILGSDIGFGKIGIIYENYLTFSTNHTIRSRFTFGFADQTMPVAEQYGLGGFHTFFGLREDDSRGRQLFLTNLEYRFQFPFRIIFDTYLKVRYDLGTISLIPEEIKFMNFQHGIGITLSLDTPIGPASFAVGRSFYFRNNLPNSPIAVGPPLFYFTIGPNL